MTLKVNSNDTTCLLSEKHDSWGGGPLAYGYVTTGLDRPTPVDLLHGGLQTMRERGVARSNERLGRGGGGRPPTRLRVGRSPLAPMRTQNCRAAGAGGDCVGGPGGAGDVPRAPGWVGGRGGQRAGVGGLGCCQAPRGCAVRACGVGAHGGPPAGARLGGGGGCHRRAVRAATAGARRGDCWWRRQQREPAGA